MRVAKGSVPRSIVALSVLSIAGCAERGADAVPIADPGPPVQAQPVAAVEPPRPGIADLPPAEQLLIRATARSLAKEIVANKSRSDIPAPEPRWRLIAQTDRTVTYQFRQGAARLEGRSPDGERTFSGRSAWAVTVVYDVDKGYEITEATFDSESLL